MMGHSGPRLFLILATVIIFILSTTFVFLATMPGQLIFRNTTDAWSDLYVTEVTPADFTFFAIWIALYAYLALFIIYAFTTLLRSSGPGYLYTDPNYLPPMVYIAFIVTQLCSIVWVFVWDNEQLEASLVFTLIITVTAYFALVIASHGLFTNQKALISYGHPNEYCWVFFLVINPLGMYAMWLTIESLITLAIVLVYSVGATQNAAGSISLAVLTGILIGYSLVDLAFYERYFRYLYTPYLVMIWSFAGILVGNMDWGTSNTVFTFGLICITIVVFIVKVVLSVCRCMRKPLFLSTKDMGNLRTSVMVGAPSVSPLPRPTVVYDQSLPTWPTLS